MTGPSLDNLPPELLNNIVNLIEDEDGWDEFPTDALLNMRETCRALERACHNRFMLYFYEWVVDLEKDIKLSKTKAVLASHIHAATIEKVTFVYKRNTLGLWKIAPLLSEVFSTLASLNRELVLVFDPFADFEADHDLSAEEVMGFVNRILVFAATSKLAIASIQVRARREEWDKRHACLTADPQLSIQEPHRRFTGIDYGTILEEIHDQLVIEAQQNTSEFPRSLIAKYPGTGEISFNYRNGCLKMRNLQTFHWQEFRDWIELIECSELEIKGCNLNPSELGRVLADAESNDHPIRSLSIVDVVLYEETSRKDKDRPKSSLFLLIQSIIPYAHELEYLRIVDTKTNPVFGRRLTLRGKQEIRSNLKHICAQLHNHRTTSRSNPAIGATGP
jgi:hypothetical protein